MAKPLIVFDIDGTLANIDHRLHLIESDTPDWKAFYSPANIMKDAPVKAIIAVYMALHANENYDVQVWSGRCESTKMATFNWMKKYAAIPKAFKMRGRTNRVDNINLKRQFIEEAGRKPSLVFDAQPGSSQFWHKRGVVVAYTVHP